MKRILLAISCICLTLIAFGQIRTISVDYKDVKGSMNTMYKECVGAGRANEGLRADWQEQLRLTKQECGFEYIRMHGLLSDDMGVCSMGKDGKLIFSYQYIDVLFDFLLSIDMRPFVELGFMPNVLASGEQTIFWWKGNVTPPKDYELWQELIRDLVVHVTERYGAEEVKQWYFEVWNEPNLIPWFWTGTQKEYFALYKHAALAVKSVNTNYRIGGPATAGAAWEPEMIAYCVKNKVPIDFISTHSYGVNQGYLDEYGETGTVLNPDPWSVSSDVLASRKEISESKIPNLELHYTEWSSSYTPADPIHDSYHSAAYILQKLKQSGDAVNSMSYWVFTDIFEEPGPRFTPFHGGFGMLNYQGIKKPAYYTYQFLNKLGNEELTNNDDTSWATKDSDGNVQILAWDFTHTLPEDSINNQQYYIKDLPSLPKGKLKIDISGVAPGFYALEVYKIGYRSNDAYTSYFDLGRPNQLSRGQVDFIKKVNNGSPLETTLIEVKEGMVSREFDLRENDVFLFKLNKI